MLVGVAPLPSSFLSSATQAFYFIKATQTKHFCPECTYSLIILIRLCILAAELNSQKYSILFFYFISQIYFKGMALQESARLFVFFWFCQVGTIWLKNFVTSIPFQRLKFFDQLVHSFLRLQDILIPDSIECRTFQAKTFQPSMKLQMSLGTFL